MKGHDSCIGATTTTVWFTMRTRRYSASSAERTTTMLAQATVYAPAPTCFMPKPALFSSITVKTAVRSSNYKIVAQSRDEMLSPAGSPSLTMWPYLLSSMQTRSLNSISIYTEKGSSAQRARLLYMNEAALAIWEQMGMKPLIIGETHRPPRSATLSFGMPFSE